MELKIFTKDEWQVMAENAHLLCFGEKRERDLDRIDYALLALENDEPLAYMTVREIDSETVYMQYGGSFKQGSYMSLKAYAMFLRYLKERYKRATTLIENTNHVMMKFAMKMGLLISGVRVFKNSILLEHYIEWNKED